VRFEVSFGGGGGVTIKKNVVVCRLVVLHTVCCDIQQGTIYFGHCIFFSETSVREAEIFMFLSLIK
jgi:hypothetical protein